MNRRSYLAVAGAVTFAGCSGTELTENTSVGSSDDEGVEPVAGPMEGETFDDFGDLSAWSAEFGTLYGVDDREPYTGSQSALVVAGDADSQSRIVRELSPPVDLSWMSPGLAMATDGSSPPMIQLYDADGDRVDFRQMAGGNRSLVRTPFGIDAVEGEPDLGAVSEIRITQWVPEDESAQLLIDDLHFVSRPDPGRVLVAFEGGYENHYTEAFPLAEQYGYPATVFVPTERIPAEPDHDGDRMTEGQVADLARAGWTIGSYGARGLDLTDLSDRTPSQEIGAAVDWLADQGYGESARCFSYPRRRFDDEIIEIVADSHDLAFAGRYPAQGRVANPYLCSTVVNPNAEDGRRALDLTAEMGGITVLSYLGIDADVREALTETLAHLDELESAEELDVVAPAELESL